MRKSALYWFGLVVTLLVALGLVILTSASEAYALRLDKSPYYFVQRQFIYLGIGIVVAAIVASIDYHRWKDQQFLTWFLFAVVLILLLAVFPPLGRKVNGSYRWINLGIINLQPSEFAKLAVVIVLSVVLDKAGWRVELWWRGAILPAALIGVLAAPILLEPDFGSVMVVGLVGMVIMFLAGVRFWHILILGLCAALVFALSVLANPNRMARIRAFANKSNTSEVAGTPAPAANSAMERAEYQAHQALVAIGNGGITGVGLNQSMQKHNYLPEAHTDFIFAIGAEELGIGFSIGVLLLFLAFFALSIYIARRAMDRLGRFLVMGMTFIIFFQAMFNLGVVCEALPTKGMALPFFSYGGTNMISAFISVGTILSVGIRTCQDAKWKKSFVSHIRLHH